jgi:hypothetical protein
MSNDAALVVRNHIGFVVSNRNAALSPDDVNHDAASVPLLIAGGSWRSATFAP